MKRIIGFKKMICTLLAAVAMLAITSGNVYASESDFADYVGNEMPAKQVYDVVILDNAALLTEAEQNELYETMARIAPYGNVMFTTEYLGSETDYEGYCEDTYYQWFGNEPGVNFQIDMGNRKLTISTSTGMDEVVASERDSIVDNIYRYATDGDYLRCATRCFEQIYDVYNDGIIAHDMKHIDNAILAVMLALFLNFIFVFASKKGKASNSAIVKSLEAATVVAAASVTKGSLHKVYSPQSSGSGGSSGGGGGGGGFSGGSSSHGF